MRVATGGFSWIISSFILLITSLILTIIFYSVIYILGICIIGLFTGTTLLLIVFFRDPERSIGDGIIAAADGIIREISKLPNSNQNWIRISTFMNIHNVHVNRMPIDGTIKKILHISGGYVPAFKKESDRNERVEIFFESDIGQMKLVLIAGTIARRIVTYIHEGDVVKKGERIGIIRLGSRVDIYLPIDKIDIIISPFIRVHAGEDTLATIKI